MMPEYVSPLDEDYISLGRAATLVAHERPGTDKSQILDMFKRAIFSGELDRPLLNTVKTRDHPGNWLHMEIEAPKCALSQAQAALPIRPGAPMSAFGVLLPDGARDFEQPPLGDFCPAEKPTWVR